jgi:hypothetical protein
LLQARVPAQPAAGSKRALTEIKLRSDPAPARLRPHETLVLQVLAYGQVTEGEQTKRVRLRVGGAKLQVQQPNGGWLSKSFRYQWKESEPFYGEENVGLAGRLLSRTTTKFTLQDAFLYTAPEQPGRYTVRAELKGKTASLAIEVTRRAPSRRTREQKSFSGGNPSPATPIAAWPSTTPPSWRKRLGGSPNRITWRASISTATGREKTTGTTNRWAAPRLTSTTP